MLSVSQFLSQDSKRERGRETKFIIAKCDTDRYPKDNALPTIFDFSSYNPSETDAPEACQSRLCSNNRKQRYAKRNIIVQRQKRYLYLISLSACIILLLLLFVKL